MKKSFVIAEAGVNHNGSTELALQLIDAAARAGADAVKFQTFKAESLVAEGTSTAEYQKKNAGDDDQFSMLKRLELSEHQHQQLIAHCNSLNIEFMSTPFDIESAYFLVSQGMKRIKVPSGELTNLPFIRQLVSFDKPMILSTGMSSLQEVKDAVACFLQERKKLGLNKKLLSGELTILHCTSNYPAHYNDVNLRAMQSMAKELNLPVGYSDHTDGVLVSPVAVAMGATIIEKHFTLDKNLPGPDHKASLEPDELEQLILHIRMVEQSMGDGIKEPRDNELPVRDLVRRSVTLVVDKEIGEELFDQDIKLLRPGNGIQPRDLGDVIGKKLKYKLKAGQTLHWKDLDK